MTDKELRKLSRSTLLEMLVEESRENDVLRSQIEQLQQQLSERQLKINRAGSIAEASLQINQVFKTVEKAAEQYLENIRTLSDRQELICKQMEEDSIRKAQELIEETKGKCWAMEDKTARECSKRTEEAERIWRETQTKIQKLNDDSAGLRELLSSTTGGNN